ncbi:MAG TPA: DinB family protein [Mycobacteriales bacterium]|nr:DinB family protein [Mycobacteriales bacterium]
MTRSADAAAFERVVDLLSRAPTRLAAAADRISNEVLRTRPGPDEWSANDVLAHLRSCADVWGACIGTILAEDSPTIRAVNPTTWITQTDYLDLEFPDSLRSFTEQRRALLDLLRPLPAESWARTATVTGAGKPLERTVLSYAERLATHERSHLKQVERAVRTLTSAS